MKENLTFHPRINIVVGANNAGKSTILKAIYRLQEPTVFSKKDLRISDRQSFILTTVGGLKADDFAHAYDPNTAERLLSSLPFAEIYFPSAGINENGHIANIGNDTLFHPPKLSIEQLKSRYPQEFSHMPNSEDSGNLIYPFFSERRGRYIGFNSNTNETYKVFSDIRNLALKVQKASNQIVTKEKFNLLCKKILGFEVGIYSGDNGENRIGLYTGYKQPIPLESMGEGTANILALITILLTEGKKVFLIEELENDIHPAALKILLELIVEMSSNNQFIISTHSNIVLKFLAASNDTKIFLSSITYIRGTFELQPTTVITEVENHPSARLEVLESLGYELFDYDLRKAYLILEESSAEKIIRDFIIPEWFNDLTSKVQTIAAQGASDVYTKFNSLNSLFVYLHKQEIYRNRSWVIVDGDEAGRKALIDLKAKYNGWSESCFTFFEQPAFEYYYPKRFQLSVAAIMKIPDKKSKKQQKLVLLEQVLKWISEDRPTAIKEFGDSAREVIEKLRLISLQL